MGFMSVASVHVADVEKISLPIDYRCTLQAESFKSDSQGEWVSVWTRSRMSFDELIYSWKLKPLKNNGVRFYLQVRLVNGKESPWLYAGYWGTVSLITSRNIPQFEEGKLDLDQLLLKTKATHFRFKAVPETPSSEFTPPLMYVITTDNQSPKKLSSEKIHQLPGRTIPATLVLDIPHRLQVDSQGNSMPNRCQSAALAAAMEYLGKKVPLENISDSVTDPEYDLYGIWPRTVQTAIDMGFDAYIDRFRDWNHVYKALKQNKVILCSITMPEDADYLYPPYPGISGHIVAMSGISKDGRVFITDSAIGLLRRGESHPTQWLREDFEKIWMGNKGGVGMVICPPQGYPMKELKTINPFPPRKSFKKQ